MENFEKKKFQVWLTLKDIILNFVVSKLLHFVFQYVIMQQFQRLKQSISKILVCFYPDELVCFRDAIKRRRYLPTSRVSLLSKEWYS